MSATLGEQSDRAADAADSREPCVGGHEFAAEILSDSKVGGIVGGHVLAQFPDTPGQRQSIDLIYLDFGKRRDSLLGTSGLELAAK